MKLPATLNADTGEPGLARRRSLANGAGEASGCGQKSGVEPLFLYSAFGIRTRHGVTGPWQWYFCIH